MRFEFTRERILAGKRAVRMTAVPAMTDTHHGMPASWKFTKSDWTISALPWKMEVKNPVDDSGSVSGLRSRISQTASPAGGGGSSSLGALLNKLKALLVCGW